MSKIKSFFYLLEFKRSIVFKFDGDGYIDPGKVKYEFFKPEFAIFNG
jgi:hypothetical protein